MKKRNYFVSLLIEKPNEDPIYTPKHIRAAYVQIDNGMLDFYDEEDNVIESFELNDKLHFDDLSNN